MLYEICMSVFTIQSNIHENNMNNQYTNFCCDLWQAMSHLPVVCIFHVIYSPITMQVPSVHSHGNQKRIPSKDVFDQLKYIYIYLLSNFEKCMLAPVSWKVRIDWFKLQYWIPKPPIISNQKLVIKILSRGENKALWHNLTTGWLSIAIGNIKITIMEKQILPSWAASLSLGCTGRYIFVCSNEPAVNISLIKTAECTDSCIYCLCFIFTIFAKAVVMPYLSVSYV